MADITPFDWGAKYDAPTFDSAPAIQKALDYAANIAGTTREGPYVEVNLSGRELMIATPIHLINQHKVNLVNGKLSALSGLGAAPIIALGNGTSGGTTQFTSMANLEIECNHISNGILINGATGQHFDSIRVHGMVDGGYGLRSSFNSGAGVYQRMNIQQYFSGESGWDSAAARTAIGFDVNKADDIFIGCIGSYCSIPLNLTSGPVQFIGCHFFNGGTTDGHDMKIIQKTGGGTTIFGNCYMDKGVIEITDNFRTIFDGCLFITADEDQSCFFKLITTAANEDASGFGVVGCEFRYNAAVTLPAGLISYQTSGGGSWKPDKKITWHGNRRGDTTDIPYAFAQWQDAGILDDQKRLVLGRTVSQPLAGLQAAIQNIGSTEVTSSYAALNAAPGNLGPHLALGKSRGDGKGTYSPILTLDRMGTIDFFGDDGVNCNEVGALIKARASADWSATDHSAEVVVSTRSGTGGMTDQVVVEKDGHLRPANDNLISLGLSTRRFLAAYAATFRVGNGAAQWLSGTGSPEGMVTAAIGSLYSQLDGSPGTGALWVKESGAGNTGWAAK